MPCMFIEAVTAEILPASKAEDVVTGGDVMLVLGV